MKLKPVALGVAVGLVWGGSLFFTTWISYFTGYATLFLKTLAESIYPGYSISPLGSVLGFVYGFLDGLISVTIIGWIYNRLVSWLSSA
ncbi:MAG: hypothetical protein D6726_00270 [Nitrospirae bacterium]|nr:MAG: hypothetical protein D6726_00270 [Nitrospirota bacterium]